MPGIGNFYGKPIGAMPNDIALGEIDGSPIYRTPGGVRYYEQYQPVPPMVPAEALTTTLDAQGRGIHTRAPQEMPAVYDMVGAVAGEALRGLTAPGKALQGEPVTYGDAWATALDYGVLSAPTSAPQGALRGGGIRAYHGSPHDFDRFSMDKIGTGEGAQAYGHGLYFAESEDVARGYRDNLTDGLRLHGKPLDTVWNDEIRERWPEIYTGLSEADADEMDALLGTMANMKSMTDMENAAESVGRRAQYLFRSRVKPGLADAPPGHMYEVNINANPDDFLDWDAPLSEQPGMMRKLQTYRSDVDADSAWNAGREYAPRNPQTVEVMRKAGIPGIKYKDGFSRGAEGGTRNYVVFDENLVEIVRKYGIAGAAAYLGMPEDELQQRMGDM